MASQRMVDAMKAAGGDPKLTIYPDAGHNSWTSAYADPQFYNWLLKQQRK
jgi:predicted peptidase